MDKLLNRDNFLSLFPNSILVAWRFKLNKEWQKSNIKHNISLTKAESINTIKDKRDIFFTPNWDYKLFFWEHESKDNRWRSEHTVKDIWWNIYALIADNDYWEKIRDDVWLKPTIVVKTKNWHHMYFLLKNPVSYKDVEKRFKDIEDKFVYLLHADEKARDIARILRVPWFTYWADNEWETTIDIVEYNPEELYSFDVWEDKINAIYNNICMDNVEKETLKKQYKWKRMWKILDETFDRVKNWIHALDVLEDLYPKFKWHQWWDIFESWEKTRWYKWHPSLNYINNFSNDDIEDRPKWWPWSIAKTKFKSLELILDYFKNKWWVDISLIRKELWSVKDVSFEDVTDKIWLNEEQVWSLIDSWEEWKKLWIYTFWWNALWLIIDEIKREIRWYDANATDIPFISALIEPIWMVDTEKWEKYIIRILKKDQEWIIDLLPTSWTNTEFRKFLQRYGIMIPNWDKFFILLYQYIYKTKNRYHYTNKLWLQIFDWRKVIIKKAWTYVDEENKIYVSIEDTWNDIIKTEDNNITFEKYIDQLISWYGWKISLPVLLSMLLWVNSFFFRNAWLQLPQVFVFWLSQSWKTTMLKNIFYSFWISKDISALSKAFVYEKNARHYMPTHFSEYRNSWHKQAEQIEWLMRNLFDWTSIEKGRSDQTISRYESNWLYVFDWQTIFTDDAVQTRMIILMANKKYQWSLLSLRTLPNIYNQATQIFESEDDFNKFALLSNKKYEELKWTIKLLRSNDRMLTNYSYLYVLLDRLWLSKYNKYLDDAMIEQDWLTSQDDIQYIYQKMFNLQVICKFDTSIYRRWLIINIVEEWLKYNTTNINDLKWFVQTINANFLWPNTLSNLTTYVDFDYVYNNKSLHWAFCRMLNVVTIDSEWKTDEEKTTIRSLREFLKNNYPAHSIIQDINFEANYSHLKKNEWERMSD